MSAAVSRRGGDGSSSWMSGASAGRGDEPSPPRFMFGRFLAHPAHYLIWLLLLAAGCATSPPTTIPRAGRSFPADAFVAQRAVLTARGRQFPLNGYLSLSQRDGMRLIVAGNFGSVLADVLVKPDGAVHVMRSSPLFRPAWIQRYLAADLQCVFGNAPETNCPGKMLSATHFLIQRRWYALDLQIVEIKPGAQPREMFDETRKEAP